MNTDRSTRRGGAAIASSSLVASGCLLAAFALAGCAPPIESGGSEALCAKDQIIGCECAAGAAGEKVCGDDGKFGACVCPDADATDAGTGRKPDAITGGDTTAPNVPDAVVELDTTAPTDGDQGDDDATTDASSPDSEADAKLPVQLAAAVTTVAGSGSSGDDDGPGLDATFQRPLGIAAIGDTVYVSDFQGNRLRAIKDGVVTTVAGSDYGGVDGDAKVAQFRHPSGIAVDKTALIIADRDNNTIRRFETTTGKVTTIAGSGVKGFSDGVGVQSKLAGPEGVTVGDNGVIYIADAQNHVIRKILVSGAVQSQTKGGIGFLDGNAKTAKMAAPSGVAAWKNRVYVADTVNHAIRYIIPDQALVNTLAGNKTIGGKDGKGSAAQFNFPRGVAVNADGVVFVSDTGGHRLRRIETDGTVSTIAGTVAGHVDGPAIGAAFSQPWSIALGAEGSIWVADSANRRVRKFFFAPVDAP